MYTRIIEISSVLDPIAVDITEEEDHELLDQSLSDLEDAGYTILADETLEMRGSTKGQHVVDALEEISQIVDKGYDDD